MVAGQYKPVVVVVAVRKQPVITSDEVVVHEVEEHETQ